MKQLLNEEKERKDRQYGRRLKKDDEEQSQRFVETAKELEADEYGEMFKDPIKNISHRNGDGG